MAENGYESFLRSRITELRLKKNVSEHRMSLDLGKSGAYIRGITSGIALPSAKEFFNICSYFGLSPADFFAPLSGGDTPYDQICDAIRRLDEDDLEKVRLFLEWIRK